MITAEDMDWILRGACLDWPPDMFFPSRQGLDHPEVRVALAICEPCPVRQECLRFAFEHESAESSRWGVYGGLTARQRNVVAAPMRKALPIEVRQLARTAPAAIVRAWAGGTGYAVAPHGTIADHVRLAYAVAMHAEQAEPQQGGVSR